MSNDRIYTVFVFKWLSILCTTLLYIITAAMVNILYYMYMYMDSPLILMLNF